MLQRIFGEGMEIESFCGEILHQELKFVVGHICYRMDEWNGKEAVPADLEQSMITLNTFLKVQSGDKECETRDRKSSQLFDFIPPGGAGS